MTISYILGITLTILFAIGLIVIAIFLIRSVKNDNEELYFRNRVDYYVYKHNKTCINSHKLGWAIILIIIGSMIIFYYGYVLFIHIMLTY